MLPCINLFPLSLLLSLTERNYSKCTSLKSSYATNAALDPRQLCKLVIKRNTEK